MISYRAIAHGSPEYEQTVQLRREILRWPLGLDLTAEDLEGETDDVFLAAFDGDAVVGCLVLTPLGAGEVKMRQVAVSAERQNKGIGRGLVVTSEALARNQGFVRMSLHARDTAVPFYLGLGYAVEGEPFVEVGIPHRGMGKGL